jgi:hypothetical protein
MDRIHPLPPAGRATVNAIETRARRLFHPRQLRFVHVVRSAVPRVLERFLSREGIGDLVRAINASGTDSPAKAEAALAERLSPDR